MAIPLIGITTSRTLNQAGYPLISVAEAYVQALIQAGAAPLLIPASNSIQALPELLHRLDGILFSGGGDIDPARFGGEPHPKVYGVDVDRDRLELALLAEAVATKLPFLGICRGCQVVNVGLGGTLYTDIASQRPDALKHDYFPDWPRDYLAHNVQIDQDSRLAHILDLTEMQVNSLHHQGVSRLAPGLRAVAYAPDRLVEALELPGHPFGLAVQWHPEALIALAPIQALFRAFVEATSKNRALSDP